MFPKENKNLWDYLKAYLSTFYCKFDGENNERQREMNVNTENLRTNNNSNALKIYRTED